MKRALGPWAGSACSAWGLGELPVGLVVLTPDRADQELVCQCCLLVSVLSCPAHGASSGTPRACPFYPSSSMTEAQWAVLEPLLPPPGNTTGSGGRPEKHPRRLVLDAIFYVVRGGIAWRQLPHDFPPAKTIYDIFRRWAKADVWQQVHDALRDLVRLHAGRDPLPTAAIVDSQTVRGADTVPTASAGYDAGKKTKGRHDAKFRRSVPAPLGHP